MAKQKRIFIVNYRLPIDAVSVQKSMRREQEIATSIDQAASLFETELSRKDKNASESWMNTLYTFGETIRETIKTKIKGHMEKEQDAYLFSKTGDWSCLPEEWNTEFKLKDGNGKWKIFPSKKLNSGLRNAVNSFSDENQFVWVGVPRSCCDGEQTEALREIFDKYSSCPVYLSKSEIEHHEMFCNDVLFPIFHTQQPEKNIRNISNDCWKFYVEINRLFATILSGIIGKDDLVWIHDYHLMLLPYFLRELTPAAKIGFFFHVPFPTNEMFRVLHVRNTLLEGVLASDLVGFQTHNDAYHFSQTVIRILGLECSFNSVTTEERIVKTGIFPIGVDVAEIKRKKAKKDVQTIFCSLQKRYEGKKIIFGFDEMKNVFGTRQKLCSFERFLKKFPHWVGRVVLVQIMLPADGQDGLSNTLNKITHRINSTFGTFDYLPVIYIEREISFAHYIAMLSLADVLLVNSLRDGMCLIPSEYIACHEEHNAAVILSEFSGAASVLSDAIRINPWDFEEVVLAMEYALTMEKEEKIRRCRNLFRNIKNNTASNWACCFISELRNASGVPEQNTKLPVEVIKTLSKKKAVFFIDVDNVYVYGKKPRIDRLLSLRLSVCLIKKKNIDNQIVLFSSMTANTMEILFKRLSDVWLCAENGVLLKCVEQEETLMVPSFLPYSDPALCLQESEDELLAFNISRTELADKPEEKEQRKTEGAWKQLIQVDADKEWRVKVCELLEYYTRRTQMSKIEKRGYSYIWHYRNSQDEFGDWQAKECRAHMQSLTDIYPVKVKQGFKSLEITQKEISFQPAMRFIHEKYPEHSIAVFSSQARENTDNLFGLSQELTKNKDVLNVNCTVGLSNTQRTATGFYIPGLAELSKTINLAYMD